MVTVVVNKEFQDRAQEEGKQDRLHQGGAFGTRLRNEQGSSTGMGRELVK